MDARPSVAIARPRANDSNEVEKSLPDQNALGNCSEEMLVSTSGRLA
jgi:hypothetical protein